MESETVLRISATREYSRNSEGAFIELKDGTILFAYTRFIGECWRDDACADIVMIKSKDCGKTWSEPEVLVEHEPGFGNVMSVSFIRLPNDRIYMIHGKKRLLEGYPDCRHMMKYSDDEGKTWSESRYIIETPGYFVGNNDRIVRLKSGRLLFPFSIHQWTGKVSENSFGIDSRGIVRVYFSDDNGENWQMAPDWILPAVSESWSGLQEPGIIELNDGRLMLWARTDQGCQYKAFSYDGGMNWTDAIPAAEFSSPCSPLCMKRDPVSGDLMAIWNDQKPRYGMKQEMEGRSVWAYERTPFVMAFSSDDGKTWKNHQAFETDPFCGFCYCAIHFNSDGSVLLGYCSGGKTYGTETLQDITIRRFTR